MGRRSRTPWKPTASPTSFGNSRVKAVFRSSRLALQRRTPRRSVAIATAFSLSRSRSRFRSLALAHSLHYTFSLPLALASAYAPLSSFSGAPHSANLGARLQERGVFVYRRLSRTREDCHGDQHGACEPRGALRLPCRLVPNERRDHSGSQWSDRRRKRADLAKRTTRLGALARLGLGARRRRRRACTWRVRRRGDASPCDRQESLPGPGPADDRVALRRNPGVERRHEQ